MEEPGTLQSLRGILRNLRTNGTPQGVADAIKRRGDVQINAALTRLDYLEDENERLRAEAERAHTLEASLLARNVDFLRLNERVGAIEETAVANVTRAQGQLDIAIAELKRVKEENERLRAQLRQFEGEAAKEEPKPQLYRVVWWQGMAQGQTLEENVTAERLEARVADWRASLSGGIGVMVGSCPMSFIPAGDNE